MPLGFFIPSWTEELYQNEIGNGDWITTTDNNILVLCSVMSDSLQPHELYSPPVSSVQRISQARILEWVAISYSRGSSQPRDWTCVSCIGRWILYTVVPPGKPMYKGESCRCCEENLIEIEKRGQRNFSWSGQ